MNVAELVADLQRLPGHLPVAGVMLVAGRGSFVTEQAQGVTAAEFQGRYVALVCDGLEP